MTTFLLMLAFLQMPPDAIRAKMTELIGGLPQVKTPLNAKTTGVVERPGYRIEKVVFESLPGFRVTANLYVPASGQPPYPAVLGTAGHSDIGKAHDTYQAMWISLARRGYVVLAYDPPGQGERIEYFDPELGRSRLGAGTAEHIASGLQCLLTGAPIARYFVWDGIRAFDYLLTRSEVDPARIAVAGNSGGGTQAAYLAVFEPRLAAAVSSCYITRWKELLEGSGPQDAEQIIPGFLAAGFDFADYIRAFAPKPFLVTAAVQDFFPIAGARATAQATGAAYFEYDDKHGWSQPRREAAYSFLDRHLKGVNADVKEAALDTESDSALWVTPTGQLATSIGSETVFTLNAALARDLYTHRRALSLKQPEELRQLVRDRLRLTSNLSAPTVAPRPGRPAIIAAGVSAADIADLRRAGFVVLDVPTPKRPAGHGGYTGSYQAAAIEWLNNRTLLAARVTEILTAFQSLQSDPEVDPNRIGIWGQGHSGAAALVATALEPKVAKVLTENSMVSWFAMTQMRLHDDISELIVPGVLRDFDLPDLVNLIAHRPIWLADPRTPANAKVPPIPLRQEYPADRVRALERPEGWPATKIYREWLMLSPGLPPR